MPKPHRIASKAHLDNAVAGLLGQEHLRRGLPGGDGERASLQHPVVEQQLQVSLHGVGGKVGYAGINRALAGVLRVGADVERDDAKVVLALAYAVVDERQRFVLELTQLRHRAIAEQVNLRAGLRVEVTDQGFRHPKRRD